MQYTIADGVVLAILAVSGFLAFSRGFTREVFAIGGWVLAAIIAVYMAPTLEPLLKELPTVGPFLENSCTFSKLVAFSSVFAIVLIVLSIFMPLFSGAMQASPLGALDKGLGFLFGVARGVLLVAVAWLIYDQFIPPSSQIPEIENARSAALMAEVTTMIEENAPTSIPDWILDPVNRLMEECGGIPGLSPDAGAATDSST